MLKRFLAVLLVVLASVSLVACKKDKRTYVADGDYTAFAVKEGKVQLTTVTVTIKDDKLTKVYIDVRQGRSIVDPSDETKGVSTFDEKTKKEKGYEYKMHYGAYKETVTDGTDTLEGYQTWLKANNKLEWFEQAALIENYIVENGAGSIENIAGDNIKTITGVTISDDNYTTVAKAAIQLAKEGKVQAVTTGSNSVTWAEAKVNSKGKLSDVVLNTLQSKTTVAETKVTFAWNAKNKQELGYEYKMHYDAYRKTVTDGTDTLEGYQAWLKANNKFEWFEQAALIVNAWVGGTTLTTDGTGHINNVTNVTISDDNYSAVLNGLVACGFKK